MARVAWLVPVAVFAVAVVLWTIGLRDEEAARRANRNPMVRKDDL